MQITMRIFAVDLFFFTEKKNSVFWKAWPEDGTGCSDPSTAKVYLQSNIFTVSANRSLAVRKELWLKQVEEPLLEFAVN